MSTARLPWRVRSRPTRAVRSSTSRSRRTPFLDKNYTIFGQTTKGLDVIHQLGVGDVIESITIENATK